MVVGVSVMCRRDERLVIRQVENFLRQGAERKRFHEDVCGVRW